MFRPDMEVRNAVSRIDRVLAAIPEGAVVLRLMLDMKKDGQLQYLEDLSIIELQKTNYNHTMRAM